jgi:hypothetical protein
MRGAADELVEVFSVGRSIAVALVASFLFGPSLEAATIQCGPGDVQCLIAAINQANVDSPHRTTIRLAGGTYALTNIDNITNGPNGLPSIGSPVTIDGRSGAILTRLTGAPDFRIFHVGATGRLVLDGITITNGAGASSSGGGLANDGGVVTIVNSSFSENVAGDTGALLNNGGVVTIIDSAFVGNFGSLGAGVINAGGVVDITRTVFENNDGLAAGGLWSTDGDVRITESRFSNNDGHLGVGGVRVSGGTASISRTTFAGNAGDGTGGIQSENLSALVVRDSAFVENVATQSAGIVNFSGTTSVINTTFARNAAAAAFAGGIGVLNFGTMTLLNSTFAENTTLVFGGGGSLSVIQSASGATTILRNTILVHNSEDTDVQDCAGVVTSLGNNLIGDPFACGMAIQLSDRIGDAGLGSLVDDGTAGEAHYPLLPDSQAIDAANGAICPTKDQIGRPRTKQHCDIGAVEFSHANDLSQE